MKRISTEAYQALREALAVITWNKRPLETFVRTALRDAPEVLAGVNFAEPKRLIADALVDGLLANERLYHEATLDLLVEVGNMTTFSNLESLQEPSDREMQLARARAAVAKVKALTKQYDADFAQREQHAAEREAERLKSQVARRFADELGSLRSTFLAMDARTDVHQRGRDFEKLLNELFRIFDMEPRLAYSLEREQIDGSLSYDTDDYILEARWRKTQVSRGDADAFAAKVQRKGKNALGLIVSIQGFSQAAIDEYKKSTPFITIDGGDLYAVLEQRVRLDDLLRAKRRYANETGSCYLPASRFLSGVDAS